MNEPFPMAKAPQEGGGRAAKVPSLEEQELLRQRAELLKEAGYQPAQAADIKDVSGEAPMVELGKREQIFSSESLEPLRISGKPQSYPNLKPGHKVICGFNQGRGERMIVCETLEQMQEAYDTYASGNALSINWYTGPDPGFVEAR